MGKKRKRETEQLAARQAVLTAELEQQYKEKVDLLCQLRSMEATVQRLKRQHTGGPPGFLDNTGAVAAPRVPAGQPPMAVAVGAAPQVHADQLPEAAAAGVAPHLPGGGQPEAVAVGPPAQLPADQQPEAVAGGPPRQVPVGGQPEAAAAAAGPAPHLPADQQLQPQADDGRLSCLLNNRSADTDGPLVAVLGLSELRLQRADLRKAVRGNNSGRFACPWSTASAQGVCCVLSQAQGQPALPAVLGCVFQGNRKAPHPACLCALTLSCCRAMA